LEKIRKTHSEVFFQGKKKFGECVPKYLFKGKKGKLEVYKKHEGWEEKFLFFNMYYRIQ
jgi:hypothetical protein